MAASPFQHPSFWHAAMAAVSASMWRAGNNGVSVRATSCGGRLASPGLGFREGAEKRLEPIALGERARRGDARERERRQALAGVGNDVARAFEFHLLRHAALQVDVVALTGAEGGFHGCGEPRFSRFARDRSPPLLCAAQRSNAQG